MRVIMAVMGLLTAAACLAADPAGGSGDGADPAGVATARQIALDGSPAAVELNEDCKYMLVSATEADRVYIFDAASSILAGTAAVEKPGFILARGEKAYVINSGKGTITVLDRSQQWKTVKTLSVAPDVHYLSAARGEHFDGRIIASTTRKPTPEEAGSLTAVGGCCLVNAQTGSCVVIMQNIPRRYFASVSANGLYVRDGECELEFADFIRPRRGDKDKYKVLCPQQVRPGSFWHEPHTIPDRTREVYYRFAEDPTPGRVRRFFLETHQDGQPYRPPLCMKVITVPVEGCGIPQHGELIAAPPVAVTYGERACLYAIASKKLVRWEFPAVSVGAQSNPALTPAGEHFPARAAEGKKVTVRVLPPGTAATLTLMEPEGAELSADGVFTWIPAGKDVGNRPVKIRLVRDGQTTFLRYEIEVLDARTGELSTAAASPVAPPGRHQLLDRDFHLAHSCDGREILLLVGCRLSFLDREGQFEVRHVDLPHVYRFVVDRPDYYLLIGNRRADILDKKTYKILRHMELPFVSLTDVAAHPRQAATFVSGMLPWRLPGRLPVVVFRLNETAGTTWWVPDFPAQRIAITRDGKTLLGVERVGAFSIACDVSTAKVQRLATPPPLPPPRDSKSVAFGPGIPMNRPLDDRHLASIRMGHQVAVHPLLPKMALSGVVGSKPGGPGAQIEVAMYSIPDGRVLEGAFEPKGPWPEDIKSIFFTLGGRHLIVQSDWLTLRTVPLRLSDAELRILEAAEAKPAWPPKLLALPPDPPFGRTTVSEESLDSLTKDKPAGSSPGDSVGKMIRRDKGEAAGFFVGKDGYFVTLASQLPLDGDPTVESYVGKDAARNAVRRPAKILYISYPDDLALLKVDAPPNAQAVCLAASDPRKDQLVKAWPPVLKGGSLQTLSWDYMTTSVNVHAGGDVDVGFAQGTPTGSNPTEGGAVALFDEQGRIIMVYRRMGERGLGGLSAQGVRRFLMECAGK